VHPTDVKVGLDDNITAEITSGLKEGDLVVMPRGSATPPAASNNGRRAPGGFGGAGALFGGGGGRRGG